MKRAFPFPAVALLLGLAAAALAINAAADLLPGDGLHGNIIAPGDSDELSIYLPANTLIDAEALAEKGSLVLPALSILDPDGEPLDLVPYAKPGPKGVGVKAKKVPAGPLGGVFTFTVTGGDGTAGRYSFRSKAKMGKKFAATLPVPAGEGATLSFDAPAGTAMSWKVKASKGFPSDGLSVVGVTAPDESETALDGLEGKKFPLSQDGTWVFALANGAGADTSAEVSISLALPKASKRVLYLSPFGFGEAPKVTSVLPNSILDDRTAEGVEVAGSNFDEAATVRLEKKDETPLAATSWTVESDAALTADFDPTSSKAGSWKLVVENPSGGAGSRTFKIQAAQNVQLPRGLKPDTEVFWIEFDEDSFENDMVLVGLSSTTRSTRDLSLAAVKDYALFYLRRGLGIQGKNGNQVDGSVPVSFCLDEPTSSVGTAGVHYNRIRVGGSSLSGDPSSNASLAWGYGPLDTGNTAYEDLTVEAGAGFGYRTAILAPSFETSLAEWVSATAPLRAVPLTSADDPFYYGFAPQTNEQAVRYGHIVTATQAVGKEIGATLAHFVARSMGIPDGISGLSYPPQKVGEYAAYSTFGFSQGEMDQMTAVARAGLPGKSKTLEANWMAPRETYPYLLPNAVSGKAYTQSFQVVGGRPDRNSGDIVYAGVSGNLPPGFGVLPTGAVVGQSPLKDLDGQLVGGVYRFVTRYTDTVAEEVVFFSHRLNLLVDTANPSLTANEQTLGAQMNATTLATP